MTDKIVFDGDYTDLKFIKTRKVAVICIEIPIEKATKFVEVFGAPSPATGVPVAIARLQEPEKQQGEKVKRQWNEVPKSNQAAMKCHDPDFRRFLALDFDGILMLDLDMAVEEVKRICGVTSRADIPNNPEAAKKWDRLYSDFQLWQRGAAA